MPPPLHENPLR